MKECPLCEKGPLVKTEHADHLDVAGYVFTASLPGLTCQACGESTIAGPDLQRFEHATARSGGARQGER